MAGRAPLDLDQRVLLHAPSGRDARLAKEVLERGGWAGAPCDSVEQVCAELTRGAAALLIAEETLTTDARQALTRWVAAQPAWSDVPILVVARADRTAKESPAALAVLGPLGNVTVLERPMRIVVLLTAIATAQRARARQYEVRELVEELERGVRDRDTFIATLSHELRNPLAAIRNALEIGDRMRAPEDAEAPERVVLRRQTRHVSRLVDDLLDVSRVTSGKIVLQSDALDLVDVVRRAVQTLTLGERGGDHDVRLHLPPAALRVRGDAVRLEQVVSNLLTNALKYTAAGKRIDVTVEAVGELAQLTVADEGEGLSEEMLPLVFELFAQAERTLDRARGGLGIGLTLVRRLVELHEGTVEAQSDGVGRGSRFIVRIPLLEAIASRSEAPASAQGDAHEARAAIRQLLLVEDNDDIRETLSMLLEHLGYAVSTASDGPSGVSAALERPPDAMLINIGLPGFDGYEVARRLRPILPSSTMLVALTGYGQPEDRRRSKESGFDCHLTKPVDIDVLDALLARGVARAPQLQE